jgi:hypothetical protein
VLTHLLHVQKKYTQSTKKNPDGHPDYKPKKVQDFKGNWTMVNGRLGGLRVVVEDVSTPTLCVTARWMGLGVVVETRLINAFGLL